MTEDDNFYRILNCPGYLDGPVPQKIPLFKLDRRELVVPTVLVFRVVEQLEAIEHVGLCVFPGQVDLALDLLSLKKLDLAFHHRVVVAVPALAHARFESMGLEEVLLIVAAELAFRC